MEGGLTLGGEYTVQNTDDALQNALETYIILVTNVTSIKFKKMEKLNLFKCNFENQENIVTA